MSQNGETPLLTFIGNDGIRIGGLPSPTNGYHLEDSAIAAIAHGYHHLFRDGDRHGKRAYAKKRRFGGPVENDRFRIRVTYLTTYNYRTSELVIRFIICNNARPAVYLMANGDILRRMTQDEIDGHLRLFTAKCTVSIMELINDIHEHARNTGITPNYYAPLAELPEAIANQFNF